MATHMVSTVHDAHVEDNNNNTIYPYPGKSKSKVWDFFGFLKKKEGPPTKDNLDMEYAVCRICFKKYANKGNTTNFKHHVDSEHPGQIAKGTTSVSFMRKVQSKISSFMNNSSLPGGKITQERQRAIDDALAKLIVGKMIPVSIVDSQHFLSFVALLDPRYKVPCRKTMFAKLEKKKDQMTVRLKEDLHKSPYVAITHDGWTSLNTESYFTTTVHFIDNDWILKSAVLGTIKMENIHTSENIAAELKKVQDQWSFSEFIATTDNARNEQKAYEILGMERFGCYGHRINLIVKHALEVSEIGRILGKARKLVTFFHQSSSVSDMLKKKQTLLLDEKQCGHKLIIDVATRWNSSLYMLRRLLEQYPCLMALAKDPCLTKNASTTIKNCVFTFEEQSIVENLVQILDPFEKATTIICSETSPTMQKVIPIVTKLLRVTERGEDDPPVIQHVKEKMKKELTKRTDTESISLLACALNPFTKDLDFLSQEEKNKTHNLLHDLVVQMSVTVKVEKSEAVETNDTPDLPTLGDVAEMESQEHESESVDGASPPKKLLLKSVDTEEFLADIVCTGVTKIDNSNAAEMELNQYIGCKVADDDYNLTILQWWKKHEIYFPRLSKIAKKYLAVPASSVPSERVFSVAGQIVNKKRCRLNFNNVDLLVFLHRNLDNYWE